MTRLWVHLKDVEWSSRVKDALVGSSTQSIKAVAPFEIKWHEIDGDYVCEMRPREGQWYPAFALVPETDFHRFKFAFKGPRASAGLQPAMFLHAVVNQQDGKGTNWQGWRVDDQIDSTNALYARFNSKPSKVLFGGPARNYIQP